jgi:hypothetical protein
MNFSNHQAALDLYSSESHPPTQLKYFKRTRLFHDSAISLPLEFPQPVVEKEKILNIINLIHFKNERIRIHFYVPQEDMDYLVESYTEPALSEEITCYWPLPYPEFSLQEYEFRHLLLVKENEIFAISVSLKKITKDSIVLRLSEAGISLEQRKMRRYLSHSREVEIRQGQVLLKGELKDFNSDAIRIRIRNEFQFHLSDIRLDREIKLTISHENDVLLSDYFSILRLCQENYELDFICKRQDRLVTDSESILKLRDSRLKLTPQPIAVFKHPFLKKRTEREIVDLSNSGCSLRESKGECILIPGMIIPELKIQFAGAFEITCQARIMYRRESEGNYLFGIAFLDMDLRDYTMLANVNFNALEPNAFLSKRVNLDALWEFLFDTGFIYPKKYQLIGSARDNFKRTYRLLYDLCPEIARHFTYEKNGRIFGHVSMIKAYSRSWLCHHLAARPMDGKIVGMKALRQILHYINSISKMPSSNTDFILAYYQPKNEFADRVYGEFTRELGNLHASSLDLFAYSIFSAGAKKELPNGFSVEKSSEADLLKFEKFYEEVSGGLFLESTGLKQRCMVDRTLKDSFSKIGFRRNCSIFSLRHKKEPVAILIIEESDFGLNLSEILNGIKVFIIDPQLKWDILSSALNQVSERFHSNEIALLIYPNTYLKSQKNVEFKEYQLWILNLVEYARHYTGYMSKKFRIKF